LFGRLADRVRRPLLWYAWAELGVGLFALCVPWLVAPEGYLATVNATLHRHFETGSAGLMLARFLCIVPVLIVPTTLMGSSLPLLSRHFVSDAEDARAVSRRVGALYAVNTLGAVSGVLLAGFVLMPKFGMAAANHVAVGMNLSLATAIFVLRGKLGAGAQASATPAAEPSAAPDAAPFPARVRIVAAIAFALSGFCSLLYEVVWSRALVNTIGGSVYAFALILMTFLIGIALGSAAASRFVDEMRAHSSVPRTAALALCVVAPLPLGVQIGVWAWVTCTLVCAAAVLGLGVIRARRAREHAMLVDDVALAAPGERPYAALAPLVPPLFASLASAAYFHSRLDALVSCAVAMASLLVALLWLLRRRLVLLLALVQVFIALATFTSDVCADKISLAFAAMVTPFYHALGEHVDRVMAMMFATTALCVLPSALGMGAMFPLTMRVWSAGGARVGREVATVYAGNTLGSIAGAWLPGFLLMPAFGMQPTLHAGIAVNLVLGLFVLLVSDELAGAGRLLRVALVPATAALLALLYLGSAHTSPLAWNLTKMTLGVFRISLAKDMLDGETWGEPDLVYYRDGLSTTVSVERWGRHYSIKNNGKVEASNGDDMPTQIMVAALPLLFHPRVASGLDAAIIGLGSGVTAGAALQFPLRSLDDFELERSVMEASRFFADVNHLQYVDTFPFVHEPRMRMINDDGRNYLASTDKRYDVIIGEPSNPWLTGVSDLFTADHFRIAKRKLRPDGIYCEWVQLYELSPENVKIIYRTLASQFKHVVVFSAEDLSSDTILVASDAELPFDLARLRAAVQLPGVADELERAYVHSPYDVLARVLLGDRDEVMRYTQIETSEHDGRKQSVPASTNAGPCAAPACVRSAVPINTDDNAAIEFAAPRDLIGFERYKGYLQTIYADTWPYGSLFGRVDGFTPARTAEEHAELAVALLAHGRKREAARLLGEAGGVRPETSFARAMLDVLGPNPTEPDLHIRPPRSDPQIGERANRRLLDGYTEVTDWLAHGNAARAKTAIEAIPPSLMRHAEPDMRYLRAYTLYKAGDHDQVIGDLEGLARGEPAFALDHPELYFFLARAHDALQHFDKAVRSARVYVEVQMQRSQPTWEGEAEPSAHEASVSDAPGESEKAWKDGVSPG
jgi:predicted membrane-bound spermidine synthase